MESKYIWYGAGLLILLLLVVTTPGWREALGVKSADLGLSSEMLNQYMPVFVILAVMGALLAVAIMGEGKKES